MAKEQPTIKVKLDIENLEKTIKDYKQLALAGGEVGEAAQKQIKPLEKLLEAAQKKSKMSKIDLEKYIELTKQGTEGISEAISKERKSYEALGKSIDNTSKKLENLKSIQKSQQEALDNAKVARKSVNISAKIKAEGQEGLSLSEADDKKYGKRNLKKAFTKLSSSTYEDISRIASWSPRNRSKEEQAQIRMAIALKEKWQEVEKAAKEAEDTAQAELKQTTSAIKTEEKTLEKLKAAKDKATPNKILNKAGEVASQEAGVTGELQSAKNKMDITGIDVAQVEKQNAAHHEKLSKSIFKSAMALRAFRAMLKASVEAVREIDDAITNMTVVTGESREVTQGYIDDFAKMAQATSSTITEMANLTTEFVRQGRTVKDAMMLSEETAKAAKIAGISVKDSLTYMTSAINGFNLAAEDASHVSDVFAAVAAATATDYNQLAVALSKVSAQANQAGMSMEYTTALLAKGIETTQEAPESIGTALKTVIARFRELRDFGSTLEDGMNVNKVEEALGSVGVALRDETGEFRNLEDVLNELGPMWDNLTGMQRQAIAQAAAGTRQQSRFLAIMQDWDRTMEITNISQQAAGASAAQYAKYAQGMTASVTKLQSAWQAFVLSLTDNDLIIGAVNVVTDLLTGFSKFINMFGKAGNRILLSIGAIAGAVGIFKIIQKKQLETVDKQIEQAKNLQAIDEDGKKTQKELAKAKIEQAKTELKMNKQKALDAARAKVDQLTAQQQELQFLLEKRRAERKAHAEAMEEAYEEAKVSGEYNEEQLKEMEDAVTEAQDNAKDTDQDAELQAQIDSYNKPIEEATKQYEEDAAAINEQYKASEEALDKLEKETDKFGTIGTSILESVKEKFGDLKDGVMSIVGDFKSSFKGKSFKGGLSSFMKSGTGQVLGKGAMTAFIAGTVALYKSAIDDIKNHEQDSLEEIASLTSQNYDSTTKIQSLKQLRREYEQIASKVNKTVEDEERLAEIEDQLASEGIEGAAIEGIDSRVQELSRSIGKNTQETISEAFEVAINDGAQAFEKAEFHSTITARLKSLDTADTSTAQGRYQSKQYQKLAKSFDAQKYAQDKINANSGAAKLAQVGGAAGGFAAGAAGGAAVGALAGTVLPGVGNAIGAAIGAIGGVVIGGIGMAIKGWYYSSEAYAKKLAEETAQETAKIANDFNKFSAAMSESYDKTIGEQFATYQENVNLYSGATQEAIKEAYRGFETIQKMGLTSADLALMQGVDDKGKIKGFSNQLMDTLISQAGELGEEAATAFFDSWKNLAESGINHKDMAMVLVASLNGIDPTELLKSQGYSDAEAQRIASQTDTGMMDKAKAEADKKKELANADKEKANEELALLMSLGAEGYAERDGNSKYKGMSYTEIEADLQAQRDRASESYDRAANAADDLTESLLNSISSFTDLRSLSQGLTSIDSALKNSREFADRLEKGEATLEDWAMAATQHQELLASDTWKNASDAEKADLIRSDSSAIQANKKRQEEIENFKKRTETEAALKMKEYEERLNNATTETERLEAQELINSLKEQTKATLAAIEGMETLAYRLSEHELSLIKYDNSLKEIDKRIEQGDLSAYAEKDALLKEKKNSFADTNNEYWQNEAEAAKKEGIDITTSNQGSWRSIMDKMLTGDISAYNEWKKTASDAELDLFKTLWQSYSGMAAEEEAVISEIEANQKAHLDAIVTMQEEAIEKYKAQMQEEYNRTKESLNERKELYEDYFDAITKKDETEDFNEKRQGLLNTISALASSTDGESLQRLKEAEKELADLEKSQRDKERNERKKNTLDSLQEEQSALDKAYKEATENNAAIWANFQALGMNAIKNLYKTVDNYDSMTEEQKKKWDEEWKIKEQQYLSAGSVLPSSLPSKEASSDPQQTVTDVANSGNQEKTIEEKSNTTTTEAEKQIVNSNTITNNIQFGDFNFDFKNSIDSGDPLDFAKAVFAVLQEEMIKNGINFATNPSYK